MTKMIKINEDTHKRLKVIAAQSGKTMIEIVAEMVAEREGK